jgi:hypothetical protein
MSKHRAVPPSIFEIAETYLLAAVVTVGLMLGAIPW